MASLWREAELRDGCYAGIVPRISDKHNGVEIQASSGMIVCLLVLLSTGEKPNKAMFQMASFYVIGLASLKELEAFIASRRKPK